MILSNYAVRQRKTVMVLAAIIIVFGSYCYSVLPRESEPDITIPYVFISTSYRGVSSSDIETSITNPIEKKLKGLDGVKKVQSVSSEGLSSVSIEFITGTDIDDALQKVKNKVDEAGGDLPADLENDPSVFEVNFSEMPIVIFSISGTCGNPCLKRVADDLQDEIEAIPGVLEVQVAGALEREIRVEVVPEKLAYYNIPITALQHVVASENVNTSGGAIRLGDGRFQLRVPGEFETPDDLLHLVVGAHNGSPVYLKDVANVVDGFKDETTRSRLNGRESINLAVKKRAGENVIGITDRIDEIIERSRPGWPSGTGILKVMDKAKEIRTNIADLENNMMTGLVLVVAVVLFGMGFRNAVIVSMAIPFSMLLTFMSLYALGITLNMVVLFGLTLALGMLVDNAIVIIENTYRFMEQGVPRIQAAMRAAGEVAWPVINSTTTTLAAFAPMLFWPGIMGEFMKFLPITLIVSLTASLFVALVINPALAAFFLKVKDNHGVPAKTAEDIEKAGEKPIEIKGPILSAYTWILRGALKHKTVVLLISFAVLMVLFQIWLLVVGIEKPIEFFPHIDPASMYINFDVPEGADMDYSDRLLKQVEMRVNGASVSEIDDPSIDKDALYAASYVPKGHKLSGGAGYESPSDIENVKHVYARAQSGGGGASLFEETTANHVGIEFIDLVDRTAPSGETINEIRGRIEDLPGAKITVSEARHGPPTGAPINIEVSGADFRALGEISNGIKKIIGRIPFVEDVRDDYVEGIPSVKVTIDRKRAALFGLSTDSVGFALKTGYNGLNVSTYREGDEDYDITVQLSDPDRRVTDVLNELMIPAPNGKLVPLRTIAKIEYSGGMGSIVHIDNERTVTVKANVDETKIPGPVARAQAEELLKDFPLPPGYRMEFTGELVSQREAEDFLSKAFVVALFLIFLILVGMFNSVIQPFIIMTAVILSLGGVFVGLTVIKSPFGIIMSGIGVISLAGVVVNNGIVLVDYINKLRERGHSLDDAVVFGGATRLRPVVLTAVTAILGLVPMIVGVSYDFHVWEIAWVSESSQWWRNMASVVAFGLILATLLTLIVVPVLYAFLAVSHERLARATEGARALYWRPYHWIAGKINKY